MYSCSICLRMFEASALLQTNQNEYFCRECFKQEYCAAAAKKNLSPLFQCRYEGDSPNGRYTKMFPKSELVRIRRFKANKKDLNFNSRRPVRCPHFECNKYVSVHDLEDHFNHEHKDIPIIQTVSECRCATSIFPRDFRYGIKQCIMLLTIPVMVPESSLKNSSTSTCSNSTNPSGLTLSRVTVSVMASRIASVQLVDNDDDITDDDMSASSVPNNDKIVIWADSNITANLRYTVAASTVFEDIRIKFYGPVLPINCNPNDMCKEGLCLILTNFHYAGMTDNGSRPLQLDVILHDDNEVKDDKQEMLATVPNYLPKSKFCV